jgi:hypothetical protein
LLRPAGAITPANRPVDCLCQNEICFDVGDIYFNPLESRDKNEGMIEGGESTETVYAITSLTAEKAGSDQLPAWSRAQTACGGRTII